MMLGHDVLFWVEDWKLKVCWCDVLNVDPDYFFGKLCNRNQCKKTGLIFREWRVDVVSNFLIR